MLGIDYESSDEEDPAPAAKQDLTNTRLKDAPAPEPLSAPAPLEQSAAATGPINGPSQGPTVSSPPQEEGSNDDAPPGSPYTSNRAIIQNLTLPTVPNFDIPPSPPGSPPQKATKKFAQFLELKKNGQHFNQRLEGSSVLRDPGHLQRLLDFASISGKEQYASALSEDVAVPSVFPEWAYAEELKVSQKQIMKAREQQKSGVPRAAVDFVSATESGALSGVSSTPSGESARQTGAAVSQMAGKRKELEHRSRNDSQSRRSPKRRRSKSRERV